MCRRLVVTERQWALHVAEGLAEGHMAKGHTGISVVTKIHTHISAANVRSPYTTRASFRRASARRASTSGIRPVARCRRCASVTTGRQLTAIDSYRSNDDII